MNNNEVYEYFADKAGLICKGLVARAVFMNGLGEIRDRSRKIRTIAPAD